MIRATFSIGTTFYFVVPSDSSCHGSVVVAIEKNGSVYTIKHACKQNEDSADKHCEHTVAANYLIQEWNTHQDYSIQYKREHIVLKPEMIQV
ncbi:hypothetical protein [Robertmurraya massiliosenegalensis]|uniref:hypothetical protein n=1 Tax=Robertmurraya massiliosenegalensis TaxID=1287657 RepID=UPI0002F44731|nr:hypothetical protein [Robertmurraya massiliosenegalensis]